MSLGFFVTPDGHGASQVVAFLLIQHEDQESLNWGFREFRLALNGGKHGPLLPGVVLTDGDGKLTTAIINELKMARDNNNAMVRRQQYSIHLLCLFHF